jgi:hypothetical protein
MVLLVPLSPCLIFGIGPFPALGIAGGAVAILAYYVAALTVLSWYILTGRSIVQLRPAALRRDAFWAILKVGGVASLIALQTNLTIALTMGLVGAAGGPVAIAGFGTGSRLEYLLIPLAFGFGAPLVAMVGTCIGAGDVQRAVRVAGSALPSRSPSPKRSDLPLPSGRARGSGCSEAIRACSLPAQLICTSSVRSMDFLVAAWRCISLRRVRGRCSGRCSPRCRASR